MRILLITLMCASLAMAEQVYAIFNVAAVRDSNLALNSAGIVDKIDVDVGSKVKKGDILLSLNNKDKLANLNGAKSQYDFAKAQYERYQRSGTAVDKNTLEQNYSNYKNLESAYNYNMALYNDTILKAPFDGVIASKNTELGNGVQGVSTTLFRLVSDQKKMIIQFDSKYVKDVKVGDTYKYSVDGDGNFHEAKIYKIYPTIDANTRKVTAEALIDDNAQPGLFGDGYILVKDSMSSKASMANKTATK
ncbi:efflux RND transporter periplasmic adaptor subunit [Helicobacter sp. 11S02629-2]|uniref:efflux RND transporter periplasmic adaptor subunit n=1 Tax=Helicobacter sp. 11S02629-2 TaxID=1476195 RepID=UPI000BA51BFD|nr:efflux RND transporter periplasmic adaptor subunit [Helicobacter sp. 11S02629-2]